VAAYYYNQAAAAGVQPVLNYKDKFPDGSAVWDVERGKANTIRRVPWQTDTSVSFSSWGYVEGKDDYKSPRSLVHDLVDIVSKNGNLLLNVGPRADGTFPDAAVHLLEQIGAWLALNGEGIYASCPWRCYGEGTTRSVQGQMTEKQNSGFGLGDVRFTASTNASRPAMFAHLLGWPRGGGGFKVRSLGVAETVVGVSLLCDEATHVQWQQARDGSLELTLPATPPSTCEHAFVFRLALADPPAKPTFAVGAETASRGTLAALNNACLV